MGKKVFLSVAISLLLAFSLAGCGNSEEDNLSTPNPDTTTTSGGSTTGFTTSSGLKLPIPANTDEQVITIPGSIGLGQKVYINGQEQTIDENGEFTVSLELVPGDNIVRIKVVSADGKSIYNTGKTIVYTPKIGETPPPTLNVTIPTPGENPFLIIEGTTDPGCTINANGRQVQSDGEGKFIVSIPLKEGDNIVTITSTNKERLVSTRQQVVTYQPPEKDILLNVSLPDAGTGYVSKSSIVVNGFTDPDNILEVYVNYDNDDEEIQSLVFSGTVSSGQFSVNVSLAEEENTITVKATNKEGKSKTVERTVYYKVE